MTEITFQVGMKHTPEVRRKVEAWQEYLIDRFHGWHIDYPLEADGIYGTGTRSAMATFLRAWGAVSAAELMEDGVTPYLRTKIRDDRRNEAEQELFKSIDRQKYRRALRQRFERADVCYPVPNLVTDDWGWHGKPHDGVDLICPRNQPVLAICKAKVIRAENGWSNRYAPLGDGIVILESLIDSGPFFKGLCFGYGHAEEFRVREGEIVEAGQTVSIAGVANAPHLHFMANGGGFPKATGHGDRDPMPFLDYAAEND